MYAVSCSLSYIRRPALVNRIKAQTGQGLKLSISFVYGSPSFKKRNRVMSKEKIKSVAEVVLEAVTGLASLFDGRNAYSLAVEKAKAHCKGNADKWQSLAKEIRLAWKQANPDPKAAKVLAFNSALSYFRKQVGIRPQEKGNGSPEVVATKAAIEAQQAIDRAEEDKPKTQNARLAIAKQAIAIVAERCGISIAEAFELIKIAAKQIDQIAVGKAA